MVTALPPSLGERTRTVDSNLSTGALPPTLSAVTSALLSCDSAWLHRAVTRGRVGDGGMLERRTQLRRYNTLD